jgi:hypothetical protein
LSGPITEALIDDKPVSLRASKVEWKMPRAASGADHTLELRGATGKPDRFYTFRFREIESFKASDFAPQNGVYSGEYQPGPSLKNFRLGGLFVAQPGGVQAISGEIAWVPSFALTPRIAVLSRLAFSVLTKQTSGLVPIVEAELQVRFHAFSPVALELGPGITDFVGFGGIKPCLNLAITVRSHQRDKPRFVDLFFAGLSAISATNPTLMLRAGLGVVL